MKCRATIAFAGLMMLFSGSGHAVRIAHVPDLVTIEVAHIELLHNRQKGGGMLIARPAELCSGCSPVSLTYDASVDLSVNGFDTDRAIDRSQIFHGSVSYDPETMKAATINVYE